MIVALPAASRRVLDVVAREAGRLGLRVHAVGGCVRDWLAGSETKDIDLVLEGDPSPLARFCARRWRAEAEAFDRFGTIRVKASGGFRVDLVRARAETYPSPASLPVVRPGSLSEDLARRDFTVNAMTAALIPGGRAELADPHGGRADLKAGLLRVLHPKSFADDPTRMFRAARYASRLKLRLEPGTESRLREAVGAGRQSLLSRERLRNELLRILEEKEPEGALELLRAWGLLDVIHPQFAWPANLGAGRGALERLGLIAMKMGSKDGAELVRSLNLERPDSQALLAALELLERRASPLSPLPALASRVLRLSNPRISASALTPLLAGGEDLKRLGLKPGPVYKERLEEAARAQWAGEFRTRAQALRWLRAHV